MTSTEIQYNLIDLQEGLFRFALSLTGNNDDAKDLVQDTFLKAIKYLNKYEPETNFKAWTYTILKNTFINNYRQGKKHKLFNNYTKNEMSKRLPNALYACNPDSIYATKELTNTIESLDDNLKLPFKMHYQGFRYKEIAETLDLNIGTVKSRIFLTRKKLMEQLYEYGK